MTAETVTGIKMCARSAIAKNHLEGIVDVEVDRYLSAMMDQIIVDFWARIYGKQTRHTVEYPASWWEHFKQDVLWPIWTGERGHQRVRRTVVEIDFMALYPELTKRIGGEKPQTRIEVHTFTVPYPDEDADEL